MTDKIRFLNCNQENWNLKEERLPETENKMYLHYFYLFLPISSDLLRCPRTLVTKCDECREQTIVTYFVLFIKLCFSEYETIEQNMNCQLSDEDFQRLQVIRINLKNLHLLFGYSWLNFDKSYSIRMKIEFNLITEIY